MPDCHQCNHTTTYSNHLEAHSQKHSGAILQCQNCDYKTGCPCVIKLHARLCPQNPKSSKSSQHAEVSINAENSGEMLRCQYCDYKTIHSHQLKAHSVIAHWDFILANILLKGFQCQNFVY